MFIWPHGLFVNEDRNVWMTDAVRPDLTPAGMKVQKVVKFSPSGEVLMTLGLQSKADYQFNVPANVVIEKNRYIILADGLSADGYL